MGLACAIDFDAEKRRRSKEMELDLSGRNVSTTSFVKSWARLAIPGFHRSKSSGWMLGHGKLSSHRAQDEERKAVTHGKSLEWQCGRAVSGRRCD